MIFILIVNFCSLLFHKQNIIFYEKFLLFYSILFYSCDLESNVEKSFFTYSVEGKYHNDGLDFVKITLANQGKPVTMKNAFEILQHNVPLYLQDIGIKENVKVAKIIEQLQDDFIARDYSKIIKLLKYHNTTKSDMEALLDVSSVFNESFNTLDEVKIYLTELEGKLIKSNKMSSNISVSFNILKASLEYWSFNYEKWMNDIEVDRENELENRELCRRRPGWFWDSINDMAEGDFWSGALGTAVGGPVGGVSGALYGSAGVGIAALFDCWKP